MLAYGRPCRAGWPRYRTRAAVGAADEGVKIHIGILAEYTFKSDVIGGHFKLETDYTGVRIN